jgi:hypothetical protein
LLGFERPPVEQRSEVSPGVLRGIVRHKGNPITHLRYSITQSNSRQFNAPPTMIAMAMKIDAITIATATFATLTEVPSRRMAYAEHAPTAHNRDPESK